MPRLLAASALFAVGLLAVTGAAQPPGLPVGDGKTAPPAGEKAAPPPKAADKQYTGPAGKKAADKKDEPVERLIEAALANDPDVKMARAEIALAEAKLAKARQGVAVKVTTLRATVQELRSAVASAADKIAYTEGMVKKGFMSAEQVPAEKDKLEAARLRLAGAEAELKLVAGDGLRAADPAAPRAFDPGALLSDQLQADHAYSVLVARMAALKRLGPTPACNTCHDAARDGDLLAANWHGCPGILQNVQPAAPAAPKGPVSDRLQAALDKPVSLGAKDAKITFEQAVEAFKKDAGLDVPVRAEVKVGPVVSLGETLPVGAWLQLFADGTPGTRLLVREYGVLVTTKDLAPPDGVSVFEFWKQKPAAPKAAPGRAMSGRFTSPVPGGAVIAREAPANQIDRYEPAFRAAVELVRSGKHVPVADADAEWAAALAGNHVRLVIPDPWTLGLDAGEPVEIVVAMADPRTPPTAAWTRLGGRTVGKHTDFAPEAAKAFAEAGRLAPEPKK